jgi:RNA polymerase sigma-70 factor (ECF subfamily)
MAKLQSKEQLSVFPETSVPEKDNLETLEATMRQYYASIYHLSLSILDDSDDAEDIAQETFIAANEKLSEFRGESDIKTWLYSIAINRSRGQLRKRKTRRALSDVLQTLQRMTKPSQSPEETAMQNDKDAYLWQVIDSLSDKHRLPVILRYAHQLSIPEIASILGLKEGTIHSRLFYAHQNIRGELLRIDPSLLEDREAS